MQPFSCEKRMEKNVRKRYLHTEIEIGLRLFSASLLYDMMYDGMQSFTNPSNVQMKTSNFILPILGYPVNLCKNLANSIYLAKLNFVYLVNNIVFVR